MTADGTTAVKMEGMELPLAWLVAMWAQAEEEQDEEEEEEAEVV